MRANIDTATLAALSADRVNLALLFEPQFESGTLNLWAGPEGHVLDYDSKQWVSVGELGRIDKVAESQGLGDSRTVVSLRIDGENIDVDDIEDSRGNVATITLLVLDDEGTEIGPISFRTTMGKVGIESSMVYDDVGGRKVTERLTMELLSETATLENAHFVRNTYEAGLRIDPTDHGLEFIADPEMENIGLHTRRGGGGNHDDRGLTNRF